MRLAQKHTRSVSLVAVLLAACSSGTPVDVSGLEEAERLWADRGFADYTYQAQVSCFCPQEIVRRVRVEVRGDQISGVVDAETSQPVQESLWASWSTIDGLFDRIRRASQTAEIVRVEATYDPELGFPRELDFVPMEGLADADWSQTIFTLTPIPAQ